MQVLCGLQVVFFLFNCQTPETERTLKIGGATIFISDVNKSLKF